MVIELIVAALISKRSKVNVAKTVLLYAAIGFLGMIIAAIIGAFQCGINPFSVKFVTEDLKTLPITMLHMFVPIVPLALYGAKILGLEIRRSQDIIATVAIFYQGAGHLSCVVFGCCHGYECQFGVYNPILGITTFTVQILDCISCLAVFTVFLLYLKKKGYNAKGVLYPIMLISYGLLRFIWEFLRDNQKVLLDVFSFDQIHSVIMMAVGAVYLYYIQRYNEKEAAQKYLKEKKKKKKKR